MSRTPNIAVVTIGYNHYAFEDAHLSLEFMAIMSKAVQVEVEEWNLRNDTPCTHFISEDSQMPKLEFVPAHKFNPHETVKEVKARIEREKKDREDIDQEMRDAAPALPALEAVIDATDDLPF